MNAVILHIRALTAFGMVCAFAACNDSDDENQDSSGARSWTTADQENYPSDLPDDLDPEAIDLERRGLDLLRAEGHAREGVSLLESAIQTEPRLVVAYTALAEFHLYGKNDAKEATRILNRALRHSPNRPEFYFRLGNVAAEEENYPNAIRHFQRALDLGYKGRASAYYNLGNAYRSYFKEDMAITAYQQALEENEQHLKATTSLISTLLERGRDNEARVVAKKMGELELAAADGKFLREFWRCNPDSKSQTTSQEAGESSIQQAARSGRLEQVKKLMAAGAKIDAADEFGWTSMHRAAQTNRREILRFLSSRGAQIDSRTIDGATPLHVAAGSGHFDSVRVLLQAGAKLEVKDRKGNTPLIQAASNGRLLVVRHLLERGAAVNVRNKVGISSLDYAAQFERVEVLGALIKHGGDAKAGAYDGFGPIHHASLKGRRAAIELLLESGVDANAQKKGWTPLLISAARGHRDVIELLLERGARLDTVNPEGDDWIAVARKQGFEDLAADLNKMR